MKKPKKVKPLDRPEFPYTVKTFEEAWRDSCEENWEAEDINRLNLEALMSTPPVPIYKGAAHPFRQYGEVGSARYTTGTFAWGTSSYIGARM